LRTCHILTVVWFQDHFAPQIAADIQAQIQGIDWDALSVEYLR